MTIPLQKIGLNSLNMAKVYAERWKIIKQIGEGGQAHAFWVKDLHGGSTDWILKRLKNPNRLARFEREVRALEALDSPHIVKAEDYSLEDPAFYVAAYVGVGLDKYASSNTLDTDHTLLLFEQIVSAVDDAHKSGVVHRDIKPNNVVVSPDGLKAYLIDFGICQYSDGILTHLTTDEAFGNPAFAAPECFLGREEEPGPPCDVYSLGKLLYWMLSQGRHINRERLSPTVLERIKEDDDLVRFYLTRLIRGTVAEDPVRRWPASRLLKEVHATRRLIERVGNHERRGEVILMDGFGVDDAFNRTSSRSATTQDPKYGPNHQMIHLGGPPGDRDIGTAFEIPVSYDVRLETINLAVDHRAGENKLDVWVAPDLNGKPDLGNIVEAYTVVRSQYYSTRVETLHSPNHPVLRQGQRYWVLLSAAAPNSDIALLSAPLDFMPRPALTAEREDGGEWEVAESPSGPGYAVRVTGRPVEPW